MSWWQRLFGRGGSPAPRGRTLSLKEQYQRKLRLFGEVQAASNRAVEILAQLHTLLHQGDYFTPLYVSLTCRLLLDHCRRVLGWFRQFARTGVEELEAAFHCLEKELTSSMATFLGKVTGAAALPFETALPESLELLASGWVYAGAGADQDGVVIKAVWGWWPAVQEGLIPARRYQVRQGQVREFVSPEGPVQEQWLTYQGEKGFVMAPLPPGYQGQTCLRAAEALRLAEFFRLLHSRYPEVKEMEWALGPQREILVLRARSSEGRIPRESGKPRSDAVLWAGKGSAIYPGVASGPAWWVDADQPPEAAGVPPGAVLFAAKPALALAPLLPKVAALVLESGGPQNHLAFVVRELGLPAIFALGEETSGVPQGSLVSVATHQLTICRGALPRAAEPAPAGKAPAFPGLEFLHSLRTRLFPLQEEFQKGKAVPELVQSIHDWLFCTSRLGEQEMNGLSLHGEVHPKEAVHLVTGGLIPIQVVDGGGGVTGNGTRVSLEEISSLPFRSFLTGMLSLPWPKGRPLDVKGFISVIGVTSTTPHAEKQLEKISLALVTERYFNFSLCLGYHLSTIEASCGANQDHNYIRFHYQGGAASLDRRLRRLQLIGEILARLGFQVTITGDVLNAVTQFDPEPLLLKKLEILGRLEVYTKQLDMLMADDGVIAFHVQEFLEKHGRA